MEMTDREYRKFKREQRLKESKKNGKKRSKGFDKESVRVKESKDELTKYLRYDTEE